MNSTRGKQDVLRCDLCETSMPLLHCDICHVNLCKPCVGEHVLDETKEHKIMPFKKRGSTPKCLKHFSKICELHCEICDCPICAVCVASFDHEQHFKIDIFKKFEEKKTSLQKDLQELEKVIYPKYQDIVSEIPVLRANLNKNTQNLKAAITKQGHNLHREIDSDIKKMKADLDNMNSIYLANLKKREDKIAHGIAEIKQNISNVKKVLDSYDVCQVCAYKSKNAVFRKLPTKLKIFLPEFISHQIDKAEINQQLGVLLELRVKTEEYDPTFTSKGESPSLLERPLMTYPMIMTDFLIDFGNRNQLCDVSFVQNEEIWTTSLETLQRRRNTTKNGPNKVRKDSIWHNYNKVW